MGISNGVFGTLTGKLGNLVSYQLNGVNVIRHIGKINKAPTLGQLAVRQKMAVVIKFQRSFLTFVNTGFEHEARSSNKNQHNLAVSYNFKHATQGEYPNITVDYSKALVTKGNLAPALNPTAVLTGTELNINWEVSPNMSWEIKNDRTMLLIFCPELNKSVYVLSGNRRSTGNDGIELPPNFQNKDLHIYLAFTAGNRKSVSDSVYVKIGAPL